MRLKPSLLCLLFVLLPFVSCVNEKEKGIAVHVKVYASMDKATPVLLKLDGKNFIKENTRPYSEIYRRVQAIAGEDNRIEVYYKVGDRDTAFVYKGIEQKNYMSIMYSRWWDKFFVSPEDSTSFFKGNSDIIQYD